MHPRMLWLAATAGWLLVALVSTVQTLDMASGAGRALDWTSLLRTQLASAAMWIPLTVAIVVVVRRHPLERGRRLRSLGVHALVVAAVIVLRALCVWLLDPWIGWYGELPDFGTILATSLRNNLAIAWLVVAAAHAVYWFEGAQRGRARIVELESGLARARLDALTARLNPHFLFNALNSIAELVHRDPDAADRMTVGLAALLRQSLEKNETHEIALRDELELLARYVEIERVRMPTRLNFEQAVDESALDCRVPPLLLQPLVENAIVHGVARRTTPGTVRLEVRRLDEQLQLKVTDDGGATDAQHRGHGLGLDNTRARLNCLYGAAGTFTLERTASGGTSAIVTLPARPMHEVRGDASDGALETTPAVALASPSLGALGPRP